MFGVCYTQSGDVKKYEQDCVKGIRIFDWPSYTCTLSTNSDGTVNTVTSYVPIDGYYIEDINFFKYGFNYDDQYTPKGEMAYYGVGFDRSIRDNYYFVYGNIKDESVREKTIDKRIEERIFSYNSYACSNYPSSSPSNIYTNFPTVDKELFPGSTSTQTIRFMDNNMVSNGPEKFGLMTLYGEDYSTGNFKNKNYRYGFVFNLYPEVYPDNYIVFYGSFKHANINVNEYYPHNKFIYRINIGPDMTIAYYAKYRPGYPKNPIVNSSSGFINEISGVSNISYFGRYRDKLFQSRPVNDLNKNYHHFAITGFDNNYGSGVSYTYYGQLNADFERNKISYSLPIWKKTVNIDSPDWAYLCAPEYGGILIDMYSISNDTNVTFAFAYFSMLAEYVE